MAGYKKEWVTYNINSGGSNGTTLSEAISFSVGEHTGREDRQIGLVITGDIPDVETDVTKNITIKQTGKPLYITINPNEFNISNSTNSIIIEGTSNSPVLFISSSDPDANSLIEQGSIQIVDPDGAVLVQEKIVDFNSVHENKLPYDNGAIYAYTFRIGLFIPENPDPTIKRTITYNIKIGLLKDGSVTNEQISTVKIYQGENYTLNVTPQELAFEYTGGTKSVTVTSNVNWTIS